MDQGVSAGYLDTRGRGTTTQGVAVLFFDRDARSLCARLFRDTQQFDPCQKSMLAPKASEFPTEMSRGIKAGTTTFTKVQGMQTCANHVLELVPTRCEISGPRVELRAKSLDKYSGREMLGRRGTWQVPNADKSRVWNRVKGGPCTTTEGSSQEGRGRRFRVFHNFKDSCRKKHCLSLSEHRLRHQQNSFFVTMIRVAAIIRPLLVYIMVLPHSLCHGERVPDDVPEHRVGEIEQSIGFYQAIELPENSLLYKKQSEYQSIEVHQTKHFGKLLLLDGVIQLTERDADSYNEMMAHVPLFQHPNPRRVLVIGGGDGYVLNEVGYSDYHFENFEIQSLSLFCVTGFETFDRRSCRPCRSR